MKRTPKPTDAALAKRYQVSTKTIARWRKDGAPVEGGLSAMQEWLSNRRQMPAGTSAPMHEMRLAKLREEVRRLVADNDEREGLLVLRSEVCADGVRVGTAMVSTLHRLPSTLAGECEGLPAHQIEKVASKIIDGAIAEIREAIARL